MKKLLRKVDGTVIGATSVIVGSIISSGDVVVAGKVRPAIETECGELSAREFIVLTGGSVTGNVTASQVTVSGALYGNVTCKGNVRLLKGATFVGNIQAKAFSVEEGVEFSGQVTIITEGKLICEELEL